MADKLTPAKIKAQLAAAFAISPPTAKKRATRPKRSVPSRIDLAGMTDIELKADGLASLEQGNPKASAACLRELQRRRGPLGLNPLSEAHTVH